MRAGAGDKPSAGRSRLPDLQALLLRRPSRKTTPLGPPGGRILDLKMPQMQVCVLLFWAWCAVRFNPVLLEFFEDGSPTSFAIVSVFIVMLNIFWLFGGYYLMMCIFGYVNRRLPLPKPPPLKVPPRVAILYTTMNDFQRQAANSCVEQNYSNFHVFILDDSTSPAYMREVDDFAARHPRVVTVVRRQDRTGYKAGNLNHALRTTVRDYSHLAIFDADSIVPESFLTDLMPYFGLGEDIAFLQGGHQPNPEPESRFARDLSLWTSGVWEFLWSPKNRFGFVFFLGHGGVVRYDVWNAIGGFPELVSEDLAFSGRALRLGYRGLHVPHVYSHEDFPETYQAFRRQQEKYVKGSCQYLHKEMGAFLRSPRPKWFEKMDLLLTACSLFVPALVVLFMTVFCILLPARFGLWNLLSVQVAGQELFTMPIVLLDRNLLQIWTLEFLFITVLCTMGPALGAISLVYRHGLHGVKFVFLSTVPFLSIFVLGGSAVVSYILSRTAEFKATGDRSLDIKKLRFRQLKRSLAQRLRADGDLTHDAEVLFVIVFSVASAMTLNLGMLAPCVATMIGVILCQTSWESRLLRPLLYLPLLIAIFGMVVTFLAILAARDLSTSNFIRL